MNEKNEDWEEVTNDRLPEIKLETAGETFDGVLLERRGVKTEKSRSGVVHIADLWDGEKKVCMLLPGDLRGKLNKIKLGTKVRITYVGRGNVPGPFGDVEGHLFEVKRSRGYTLTPEVRKLVTA